MVIALDTTTLTYALAGTGFFSLVSFFWAIRLEVRMRKLLGGTHAKTLTNAIKELHDKADKLAHTQEKINAYLSKAEHRIARCLQGVATVRFNPFKGQGGGSNQSFATALINEHGDGVVVSSLHSRDRVSVYAKPVTSGTSEYELSAEEKEALVKASGQYRSS